MVLDATYLQLMFNPDTHIMNNIAISGFDHNMDMIQKVQVVADIISVCETEKADCEKFR